jgi:phenylacetate-coenzyme A ligase PaaK-like adenylate-forming protein
VFDRYGSTELGAFAQCREEGEWHNPAPEIQYHEIVDPDSGRRLPDGERGMLALTHLDRRGTVLVRFLVGDTVSLVRGACPHCGRSGDRVVGPVARAGDLVKVKGMLVNPAVMLEALNGIAGIEEFQVVVRRPDTLGMDELVVRLACSTTDRTSMENLVSERIRQAVRVTPLVEFVAATEIYDPSRQAKAARFVDLRV